MTVPLRFRSLQRINTEHFFLTCSPPALPFKVESNLHWDTHKTQIHRKSSGFSEKHRTFKATQPTPRLCIQRVKTLYGFQKNASSPQFAQLMAHHSSKSKIWLSSRTAEHLNTILNTYCSATTSALSFCPDLPKALCLDEPPQFTEVLSTTGIKRLSTGPAGIATELVVWYPLPIKFATADGATGKLPQQRTPCICSSLWKYIGCCNGWILPNSQKN